MNKLFMAIGIVLATLSPVMAQETACITVDQLSAALGFKHTNTLPNKDGTTTEFYFMNDSDFVAAHFDSNGCAITKDGLVVDKRSALVENGIVLN